MAKSDYVAADEAKLNEIVRQAESRLAAQLTLGVAADQRAMTLAGILSALAAALVAFGSTTGMSLPLWAMTTCLLISAFSAIYAAQPVAWNVAGTSPTDWIEDIAEAKDDLLSAKAAMASFYAEMIAENDVSLASNGNFVRFALFAAVAAPIAGMVSILILHP